MCNCQLGNRLIIFSVINPFHATGLLLRPLKTSENQGFSDVFRVYRKRPMLLNGLTHQSKIHLKQPLTTFVEEFLDDDTYLFSSYLDGLSR